MTERCDICRGSKTVRMQVYRPLRIDIGPIEDELPRESSREFPCPQCCPQVPVDRIGAVQSETYLAETYINEPALIERVREHLARMIGHQLLEGGYIKFERRADTMKYRFVGTVEVALPSKLKQP